MGSWFSRKASSEGDISKTNKPRKTSHNEVLRSNTFSVENQDGSSYESHTKTTITYSDAKFIRNTRTTSSHPISFNTSPIRGDALMFRNPQYGTSSEFVRNTRTTSSHPISFNTGPIRGDALMFRNPQYGTSRRKTDQKPEKYKVKKTYKFYDNSTNSLIPVYSTHSKNRGRALIINNIKFYKENLYRKGARKDSRDLEDVLQQIGFRVKTHYDVEKKDIESILKNFSKDPYLRKVDICFVVVMSHGTNNNIPGGHTEILCTDGKKISNEEIIDYFNESDCVSLKNKPKVFIFQCCRNSMTQTDAIPTSKKPQDKSNTLIAYSTIPGFVSNRDVEDGTWYIQTICKVFSEYAHEFHVQELLSMVDKKMKELDDKIVQVSSYENRGFANCYLHPR